jgi:hypothetical protein
MNVQTATTAAAIAGRAKLGELARVAPGAVISVYLDTGWVDEHQRERVRIFLENESRRAAAMGGGELAADLAWIATEGDRLVAQEDHAGAAGVALFAGDALRETIPLAVPVRDSFTVADAPRLRPLVEALGQAPRASVVFVDGERGRVVTVTEHGTAEDVTLDTTDVVGHHRRGGWSLLLQSRYQRHAQVHRAQHFEAVAEALADAVKRHAVDHIVIAGDPRNRAIFRRHVPRRIAGRIVGEIAAPGWEATGDLVRQARQAIRQWLASEAASTVDALLAAAGGGGRATAGVKSTLEVLNQGAVDRLYLLAGFQDTGSACQACGALQHTSAAICPWCGRAAVIVELGEAMVRRTLGAGGAVGIVPVHAALARAGGVAARLRHLSLSGRAHA